MSLPVRRMALSSIVLAAFGLGMPGHAAAAAAGAAMRGPDCTLDATLTRFPPRFNVYLDNDLFAGQDQGYTNGARFSLVSPNVQDLLQGECIPRTAQRVNRIVDWLLPAGVPAVDGSGVDGSGVDGSGVDDSSGGGNDGSGTETGLDAQDRTQLNMVLSLAQQIYTPTDFAESALIEEDRPYAGWLYLGLGYNARRGGRLHSTELRLGMVGPSAHAETTQDFVHHLRGIPRFAGWDNQLRDELGVQLLHERKQRYVPRAWQLREAPWAWDAITHWGGSLGNVATYVNAGVELRFGWRLQEDFGTSTLRPAADRDAPLPVGGSPFDGISAHAFLALDGRAVARDIFLDGNTFKDSHSVERRPFVGDAAVGVALTAGGWTVTFARYFRSREFEGQGERPGYGAVLVSGSFW